MNQNYLLHILAETVLLIQPALRQNLCFKSGALLVGMVTLITHLNCIKNSSLSDLGPPELHFSAILRRSVVNVCLLSILKTSAKHGAKLIAKNLRFLPPHTSQQLLSYKSLHLFGNHAQDGPKPFRLSHAYISSFQPPLISSVLYSSSLSSFLFITSANEIITVHLYVRLFHAPTSFIT